MESEDGTRCGSRKWETGGLAGQPVRITSGNVDFSGEKKGELTDTRRLNISWKRVPAKRSTAKHD